MKSMKTESSILTAVHKTIAALHRSGLVDQATMREFDTICLTPIEPSGREKTVSLST